MGITEREHGSRLSRRVAWFVLLYAGSLAVFAVLVYGLRSLIPH